jgi:hypothetical protein
MRFDGGEEVIEGLIAVVIEARHWMTSGMAVKCSWDCLHRIRLTFCNNIPCAME